MVVLFRGSESRSRGDGPQDVLAGPASGSVSAFLFSLCTICLRGRQLLAVGMPDAYHCRRREQ